MRRKIKLMLLAIGLFFACCAVSHADEFEDGWDCGWEAGWKQIKGEFSIVPITPLAPLPPIDKDTFQGGYNLGFLAGIAAASRD